MWEDPQNKNGGRWLVNLNKNQRMTELDNFWLETVSIIVCLNASLRRQKVKKYNFIIYKFR